jgi:hypothetical protein
LPVTKLMRTLSISVAAPPDADGTVTRTGVSPAVATIPVSTCCRAARSRYIGNETIVESLPRAAISTSADGFSTGSGLSASALMNVKIAVLAPMPSARERTAAVVNAGALRSARAA